MLRSKADEYFSVDEIVLPSQIRTVEDWRELVEGKRRPRTVTARLIFRQVITAPPPSGWLQ